MAVGFPSYCNFFNSENIGHNFLPLLCFFFPFPVLGSGLHQLVITLVSLCVNCIFPVYKCHAATTNPIFLQKIDLLFLH